MVKMRQLKNAAKLWSLTDLRALKDNVTRWSSKYEMVKRYLRLESHLKEMYELGDCVLRQGDEDS